MSAQPISNGQSTGQQLYEPGGSVPWRQEAAPMQNGTSQQWKHPTLQQIPIPVSANGSTSGYHNRISTNGTNGIPHPANQPSIPYVPNGNVNNGHYMNYPVRNNGFPSNMNGNGNYHPTNRGQYTRSTNGVTAKKVSNSVKKQKRNRTAFTTQQMMELEQEYARARYLDRNRRLELSGILKLHQRTIKIWFQNRRMKEKKDRAESLEEADESSSKSSPEGIYNSMPALIHDQHPTAMAPAEVYGIDGIHHANAPTYEYIDHCQLPATLNAGPNQMLHPQMQPPINQYGEHFAQYPAEQNNEAGLKTNGLQAIDGNLQVEHLPPASANVHEQQPVLAQVHTTNADPADQNWDLSWIRSMNIDDDI